MARFASGVLRVQLTALIGVGVPMKNFMIASALVLSAALPAFANPADVEPSADVLKPSVIQSAIVLQTENIENETPSITLIKVTNGGSSDNSSFVSPSRVYLGLHRNG